MCDHFYVVIREKENIEVVFFSRYPVVQTTKDNDYTYTRTNRHKKREKKKKEYE
jgi:hypothetical protein